MLVQGHQPHGAHAVVSTAHRSDGVVHLLSLQCGHVVEGGGKGSGSEQACVTASRHLQYAAGIRIPEHRLDLTAKPRTTIWAGLVEESGNIRQWEAGFDMQQRAFVRKVEGNQLALAERWRERVQGKSTHSAVTASLNVHSVPGVEPKVRVVVARNGERGGA